MSVHGYMELTNNEYAEIIIKRSGIKKWEVAQKLKIREESLSRWFRNELTDEQLESICKVCPYKEQIVFAFGEGIADLEDDLLKVMEG